MSFNRRNFLKQAGLIAGSAVLPAQLNASVWTKTSPPETDEEFWNWVTQQYSVSASLINLNNGGVSPQPVSVQQSLQRFTEFCNEGPSYYMWRQLEPGRVLVRKELAALIGASDDEVAINRNATEALDTIIRGIALKPGDEVVLSKYDYPRMMHAWKRREKNEGIVLKWVDFSFPENDAEAIVKKYTSLFTSKTKVVHITHLINWVGQILPVKEIAAAAKQKGIKSILDAAHTFAHITFDIKELGVDYMGTSLHKWLCAPFGTGMIYVAESEIPSVSTLFSEDPDAADLGIRKFEELGTRNVPAELAIGDAINFHLTVGAKRKQERLYALKEYWTARVAVFPGVRILSPASSQLSGAIGFITIDGKDISQLESYLLENYRIHTTSIKYEGLNGVRISPHIYTSFSDLDYLVEGIQQFIEKP